MRESKFWSLLKSGLNRDFWMHRSETKNSDGLGDLLVQSPRTGQVSHVELKSIKSLPKRSDTPLRIDIQPEQALFARNWASVHPNSRSFVLLHVVDGRVMIFRATSSVQWVQDIKAPLTEEVLARLRPMVITPPYDWEVFKEFWD